MDIAVLAAFEGRNGEGRELIRVETLTSRQFSYVIWFERRYLRRRLVAIVGEELTQEGKAYGEKG